MSYRQWDGKDVTARVAWALRAVGIPVWHDETDLPPGDTIRVIGQALNSGLSGAVLVVTDDIVNSSVVKKVEWPKIRELNEEGEFTLGVLNAVKDANGNVYAAPDRLLRRWSDRLLGRYTHHLRGLKQYRLSTEQDQISELAADMLRQRLHHLADSIAARGYVHIDLATRADPTAEHAESADLSFRWDRSGRTDGEHTAERSLHQHFHVAAASIRQHTTGRLRFHGQAHLSFGTAIGASLTLGPAIEFANEDGLWVIDRYSDATATPLTRAAIHSRNTSGPVLVFVDLLPPESAAAYDSLVLSGQWTESVRIQRPHRSQPIRSEDASQLAHEIATTIREASGRNRNAQVHLLVYAPLPIALFVGSLLNTVDVVVYEWQRPTDGHPAAYVPTFRLRPGEPNPISIAE
ncbi:SAVED domain-containing protein [Microbacterium sp. KSW4-4]|nr:SAVED domain-containing protein [Microbacterium sp. KSW4-4]